MSRYVTNSADYANNFASEKKKNGRLEQDSKRSNIHNPFTVHVVLWLPFICLDLHMASVFFFKGGGWYNQKNPLQVDMCNRCGVCGSMGL